MSNIVNFRKKYWLDVTCLTVLLVIYNGGITNACETNVCNRANFGLYCPDNHAIYVNFVKCNLPSGHECIVARRNILLLCTGQRTCAAHGLRKILKTCRKNTKFYPKIVINYSCIKRETIFSDCNNGKTTLPNFDQAVITSPYFTNNASTLSQRDCTWLINIPRIKVAEMTLSYFSTGKSEGACVEPPLTIRYQLCNGAGVKTKDVCGFSRPESSKVCRRVTIKTRWMDDNTGYSSTKFIISLKVFDVGDIKNDLHSSLQSSVCDQSPPGYSKVDSTYYPPNVNVTDSMATSPPINLHTIYKGNGITESFLLVIVLVVIGAAILVLLVSIVFVCYKATRRKAYKLEKSTDTNSTRVLTSRLKRERTNSFHEEKGTDADIEKAREFYSFSQPSQTYPDSFSKYFIHQTNNHKNNDITFSERPKSDTSWQPYSSVAEANEQIPFTTNENRYSFGDMISVNPGKTYESLTHLHGSHGDGNSSNGDYDNVEYQADTSSATPTQLDPDTVSQNSNVPHYFVNGDTYAIVQKSPPEQQRSQLVNYPGMSKKKSGKLKSKNDTEPLYNNHTKYIDNGDEFY